MECGDPAPLSFSEPASERVTCSASGRAVQSGARSPHSIRSKSYHEAVIEQTAATAAEGIRPEEEAAIMIVWRGRGHPDEEQVPEADALQILDEIRQRENAIEQRALRALNKATKENRRYPRRHQQFALLIVLPLALLLIFIVIALFGLR